MKIFLGVLKLLLLLHPQVTLISIVIAAPIVVLFWLVWLIIFLLWPIIWIFRIIFRGFQRRPSTLATDRLAFNVSTEKLLGPIASGMIASVFEGESIKAIAHTGSVRAVEVLELKLIFSKSLIGSPI